MRFSPSPGLWSPLTKAAQAARYLRDRDGKGYAPLFIDERRPRDTFDTPENRFVRHCLTEFLRQAHALRDQRWWGKIAEGDRQGLARLIDELAQWSGHAMFDEVGPLQVYPASSQVLLRRYGYRELAQLWRHFQFARRPFFGELQEAIDLHDVAALYEFWCFYELTRHLTEELGPAVKRHVTVDESGLRHLAKVDWGEKGRLIYNRTFGSGSGSYSLPLRPDFIFERAAVPGQPVRRVVFDAKFRFRPLDWIAATSKGDPQRLPQDDDIYKMHTYRDALGADAAVVLYPGTMLRFFPVDGHSLPGDKIMLKTLLDRYSGVGALPLEPGATATL